VEKQGIKNLQDRLNDMQDSFAAYERSWIKGATILLVDDVVTSGATAQDAARALKKGGAANVEIAAFARALGSNKATAVVAKSSNTTDPK
jgi:predicted amidophosphoribosyltransferase